MNLYVNVVLLDCHKWIYKKLDFEQVTIIFNSAIYLPFDNEVISVCKLIFVYILKSVVCNKRNLSFRLYGNENLLEILIQNSHKNINLLTLMEKFTWWSDTVFTQMSQLCVKFRHISFIFTSVKNLLFLFISF